MIAGFLHGASHETTHGVFQPAHFFHNFRDAGAVLALEHGDYLGGLTARARSGGGRLSGLLVRGRTLGGGGLLGQPCRSRTEPPLRPPWPACPVAAGWLPPRAGRTH